MSPTRPPSPARPSVALTIAGSDPSGGAGLQADLKTFAALGVYGMSALTVATDCETLRGVTRVEAMPPAFVARQIERVWEDIPPGAVKTGMLYSEAIIREVAEALRLRGPVPLVVDPVMTTRRGERLLSDGAEAALARELLPLAAIATPSLPEAERLTGLPVGTRGEVERAAAKILELGAGAVVVTGGHGSGPTAADCFASDHGVEWLEAERAPREVHGAGDTFSAAVAAGLARGRGLPEAVRRAKAYVTGAVHHAPAVGRGNGPLGHGWEAAPDRP